MTTRRARRTVLILMLAIGPAFLNGCILTDLLGGLGGGGGLGGLLGGAGGAGQPVPGQQAANPAVPNAGQPGIPIPPVNPTAFNTQTTSSLPTVRVN